VAVGLPLTVTVTDSAWAVVMPAGDGETVTVGVVFTTGVIVYVAEATVLCV
jgi:S1-C subfamily serine protease